MRTTAMGALVVALLFSSVGVGSAQAAAVTSPLHVEFSGSCPVPTGVAGNWDVYQEIFQAGSPTWLPAHTHAGVECTVTVLGTASWWLQPHGVIPLPLGKTFYTPEGTVHTAGNISGAAMRYLAIHVITAGQPFRTLVNAPTAPKDVSTATKVIFESDFMKQPSSRRGFIVRQALESLDPRGVVTIDPSTSLAYYTVTAGTATFTLNGKSVHVGATQKIAIPRNTTLRITNTTGSPVQLAVAELADFKYMHVVKRSRPRN